MSLASSWKEASEKTKPRRNKKENFYVKNVAKCYESESATFKLHNMYLGLRSNDIRIIRKSKGITIVLNNVDEL